MPRRLLGAPRVRGHRWWPPSERWRRQGGCGRRLRSVRQHRPHPRAGQRPLPEQRCPGQRGDAARVHQVIQNAAARCAGLRAGAAPALEGCGAARIPARAAAGRPGHTGAGRRGVPPAAIPHPAASAAPSTEDAGAAAWRRDSVYPPDQHGCAWPPGAQLAPRWEALTPHPAVGPARTIWPHSTTAVTAAHRACPRAAIAAGGPTQRLLARRAPEAIR